VEALEMSNGWRSPTSHLEPARDHPVAHGHMHVARYAFRPDIVLDDIQPVGLVSFAGR
jgi:hypothetical protein